eukprot:Lankesteria_metandrocarpae@DN5659_c0_g1_i2.p1
MIQIPEHPVKLILELSTHLTAEARLDALTAVLRRRYLSDFSIWSVAQFTSKQNDLYRFLTETLNTFPPSETFKVLFRFADVCWSTAAQARADHQPHDLLELRRSILFCSMCIINAYVIVTEQTSCSLQSPDQSRSTSRSTPSSTTAPHGSNAVSQLCETLSQLNAELHQGANVGANKVMGDGAVCFIHQLTSSEFHYAAAVMGLVSLQVVNYLALAGFAIDVLLGVAFDDSALRSSSPEDKTTEALLTTSSISTGAFLSTVVCKELYVPVVLKHIQTLLPGAEVDAASGSLVGSALRNDLPQGLALSNNNVDSLFDLTALATKHNNAVDMRYVADAGNRRPSRQMQSSNVRRSQRSAAPAVVQSNNESAVDDRRLAWRMSLVYLTQHSSPLSTTVQPVQTQLPMNYCLTMDVPASGLMVQRRRWAAARKATAPGPHQVTDHDMTHDDDHSSAVHSSAVHSSGVHSSGVHSA